MVKIKRRKIVNWGGHYWSSKNNFLKKTISISKVMTKMNSVSPRFRFHGLILHSLWNHFYILQNVMSEQIASRKASEFSVSIVEPVGGLGLLKTPLVVCLRWMDPISRKAEPHSSHVQIERVYHGSCYQCKDSLSCYQGSLKIS